MTCSLKIITKNNLMTYLQKEVVLGYCRQCPSYGINHSCPDFSFATEDYISNYNFAAIIIADEKVTESFNKSFEVIKQKMSSVLLNAEKSFAGSLALFPGRCTGCKVCTKSSGKGCRKPQKLRYSLEALGFMVSDIYKGLFTRELEWNTKVTPANVSCCGAILFHDQVDYDELLSVIQKML
jgi:predicted metal-binding protein